MIRLLFISRNQEQRERAGKRWREREGEKDLHRSLINASVITTVWGRGRSWKESVWKDFKQHIELIKSLTIISATVSLWWSELMWWTSQQGRIKARRLWVQFPPRLSFRAVSSCSGFSAGPSCCSSQPHVRLAGKLTSKLTVSNWSKAAHFLRTDLETKCGFDHDYPSCCFLLL